MWLAAQETAGDGHEPYATVVREALAAAGLSAPDWDGTPAPPVSWQDLGTGEVDWRRLLCRPELREHQHPGWLQVGAAALLRAAADGLFDRSLAGPVPVAELVHSDPPTDAPDGDTSSRRSLVDFAVAEGWLEAVGDRVAAGAELRRLAGVGHLADPAAWFRDRMRFELDWFWQPLGGLGRALRGGTRPASFATPPNAGVFRAATAVMNLPADPLRAPAARAVAALVSSLGSPARRLLEQGAGTGVWGRTLALAPGCAVTAVDYPEVLAVTRRAAELAAVADRYEWHAATPAHLPAQDGYDLAVAPDVLHTLPADIVPGWLSGLAARLRPGGQLLIVDPLLKPDRLAPARHLLVQVKLAVSGVGRIWDVRELRAALIAAGLTPAQPRQVQGLQVYLATRPQ